MATHEHNLLPFSTPQSYALLSAKSKATEAANNKERLGECHNNVWCHTCHHRVRDVVTSDISPGDARIKVPTLIENNGDEQQHFCAALR